MTNSPAPHQALPNAAAGTSANPKCARNRTRNRMPVASLGIVLVLALFWAGLGSLVLPTAKRHDFLNLYAGADLALKGRFADLHSPEVQLAKEQEFVPETQVLVPFVRPHFYAALLAPLALIPFDAAFVTWVALQAALLFAAWYWAWKEFGGDGPVMAAMFPATALGIAHGQDVMFMVWIAILTYMLAKRKMDFRAGLVLSLALLKFHLILLIPVAMLVRRDWRMLGGFSAGGAAGVLLGLLLGGIEGSRCYIEDMLLNREGVERLFPTPELMTNIDGLTLNLIGDVLWFKAVLTLLACVFFVVAVWRTEFRVWFPAALLATLLIVPHVHGYDLAILLMPLLLCVFTLNSKAVRITATIFMVPITGLLPLAGTPWAAAPALAMIVLLAAIALEGRRARIPSTT